MTRIAALVVAAALLCLAAAAGSAQALPHSPAQGLSHRNACGLPGAGSARCHAKVVTTEAGSTFNGAPDAGPGVVPAGWGSADLQAAYKLGSAVGTAAGSGPTIAIVDAFHNPKAEEDLAVYRAQMHLPACGSVGGCFTQVNQRGAAGSPPASDTGWAEEISLDLDMASSSCPQCKLLLVEADSNSFANLMAAVDTAYGSGAKAISNSYGAREFRGETSFDSHFNHPGVAITVSSGDAGYGTEYPAASPYVTATGGTSLSLASGSDRGYSETAWSGAGSGCSSYEAKQSWQTDTRCARRAIADVSSVSDPNTGVAVYDTFNDPGWMVFGGTSAAAPFIAGVYALGGVQTGPSDFATSWPYTRGGWLFDVIGGSNGRCSKTPYLCSAVTGYDGPTGLGTPNGVRAF